MRLDFPNPLKVFNAIYLKYSLYNVCRYQINFGGSSSGKSFFLAQRVILDVLKGRNYLITRKRQNTIKKSVFNEITKGILAWGLTDKFDINKSEFLITCKENNKQIYFCGIDDPEKLKSITPINGVITDIWMEEATECDQDDLNQLNKRLRGKSKFKKRITLSFNPIRKSHWIYKRFFEDLWIEGKQYIEKNDVSILKTTHIDNAFLEQDDRDALINEKDPYYYNVYTLGNWGMPNPDALVFNGYNENNLVLSLPDIKREEYNYIFGGYDRGFTHRTGLVVVGITYDYRFHVLHSEGVSGLNFMREDRDADSVLVRIKNLQAEYNCQAWFCSHEAADHIDTLRSAQIEAISWLKGFPKKNKDTKDSDKTKTNARIDFLNMLLRENMLIMKEPQTDDPCNEELINDITGFEHKKIPMGGYNRNEYNRVNDDVMDALTFAIGGYRDVRLGAIQFMEEFKKKQVELESA